jgi:small subunit ribosomal protein S13
VFLNGFNFTEATLVKVHPHLFTHNRTLTSQRSLESFFGIGPKVCQGIMAKFHIHPWAKVGSLKNTVVLDLTAELSNMKIENDLRREVRDNIMRLKDMGTYRGRRHAMGLPVRGQRTRTQVSVVVGSWCDWMLTMVDHDCEKAEQDRERRPGTGAVVVGGDTPCTILYNAGEACIEDHAIRYD